MSNRLLQVILALYPRTFRRRYSREMRDLVNDLEAASDRSRLRLVSELLLGAAAERLEAARQNARWTITTLAVVAAVAATVDLHWSGGGQRFPRAIATAGTHTPQTARRSARLDSTDTATGQSTPSATNPAAPRGAPPLPAPSASMRPANEGSNWTWQ
jgi:hypothetical protein